MKYLNLGLTLILALALVFLFLVLPGLIKIQKVECYSQYGLCAEETSASVNKAVGQVLREAKVFLNKQLKGNGAVEKFGFVFKLPATLRVNLVLRKAKFALSVPDLSACVVLDKDGLVLEQLAKTNLPKVIIRSPLPNVGARAGPEEFFALNLIYDLNFFYQVEVGVLSETGLIVKLPSGPSVVFPLEGDKEILLASLKLILSQGRSVKLIDLRFKNPIIK